MDPRDKPSNNQTPTQSPNTPEAKLQEKDLEIYTVAQYQKLIQQGLLPNPPPHSPLAQVLRDLKDKPNVAIMSVALHHQ